MWLFVPAISSPPANDAASRWPASVVASPNRRSIVAVTMLFAVFFGQHRDLHAVGQLRAHDAARRCSGSSDRTISPRDDASPCSCSCAASSRDRGAGGDDGAVGRRVGDVVADGPVGRLEIRLRDAHEIGRRDRPCSRSCWRNISRQSPCAMAVLSAPVAIDCAFDRLFSSPRSSCVLTRSTSASRRRILHDVVERLVDGVARRVERLVLRQRRR